jgi:hypothetical protein
MDNQVKKVAKEIKIMDEATQFKQRRRRNMINSILNRYFGFVVIVVVALIFWASYKYFINPEYKKIVAVINETFFEKNQLIPKYREVDSFRNIIKAYKLIDPADVARVNDMVPAQYIKEDLFTELVYIVSRAGFKVNSLDVVKDTETAATTPAVTPGGSTRKANDAGSAPAASEVSSLPYGIGRMNAKIDVAGVDYPKLKTLLKILETSLRLIDINNISFNPATNSVVINLSTYYMKK